MRKIIKIIMVLSLLFASMYEVKAQDYKGEVVVRSHSIREENDSLKLTYDLLIMHNSVISSAAMRLTPKITAEADTYRFADVMIQGRSSGRTYDRWLKTMSRRDRNAYIAPQTMVRVNEQTDTLITFSYAIPYQMWMDDATLAFEQELISYNNDRSLVVFALDANIKFSSRTPYVAEPTVRFTMPAAEKKMRNVQGQAFLDFHVGKSVILPNYRRNIQELGKIEAAFRNIEDDKDVQINGFFIEGYASPDGKYESNDRLSRERAEALKDYIISKFTIPLSGNWIHVANIAEDWDGLRTLLQASNMVRRDDVIAIIDKESDISRRKQKIQALSGGSVYRTMLTDMFPKLRRVEYQIDFWVKDFGTDQAILLIDKQPELLSQQELYLAAQSYGQSSREFENIILDVIPRLFKDDPTANINAAAIMIRRGELIAARRVLEKYHENPASWNNLGVLELMAGELDTAQALLRMAKAQGDTEAIHNLAEVEKKRRDNIKMERYNKRSN